ncbi:terpene synthase family protein [Nonomuraea gerenzanensis]|uniref:Terpene synthase, metal-binding n=1 Tax=Nonomuraea gerenzanensis TaxID=93944 RepID=A0A1M4EA12_9ACTN|nr:terpene synthase family protein [Nonomuraea gerenzanensis]UBU17769.1 terpene synthase family protein [Nonomuraea gerenzanensis]SBO95548.1 Terpene synthase, metal-binding [Nonomuraea gerenzanensis]
MPDDELDEAFELGRTCALAAECGRDLRRCAQMYADLFPDAAFGADFFSSLSLATAFSAPWAGADRLKAVNRAALWVTAVDRLVDRAATTREQVTRLTRECLSVAEGAVPRSAATRFLADLRDELATVGGFEELQGIWRDQLERMLAGMAEAWVWRDTHTVPTLARYVENADSRGSCFVDLSHWIYTADDWARAHLEELRAVSRQVQRYLHLLGDVASYRRDLSWGDLNALALGVDGAEVAAAIAELAREADELIRPVCRHSPRTASYLRRRLGFQAGVTGISDYQRAT